MALAPGAIAVSPTTATAYYDCGTWGSTILTLNAAQYGTTATITLGSSDMVAPIAIPENTTNAVLRLERNGGPDTTLFTGQTNPPVPAGSPIELGPLIGTVAPGDSLDSYVGGDSLSFVIFGISVRCAAMTKQSPGPFVFD
ncbi:hypothetical protein ACFS5L_44385 [Streptomyces phyllanthi]|uniref:hypothetical protein n=1 Tax=Streptomyces phyllanthi TaxID=1803180 RepID=UPI002AD26895|nr:hypothetical protein [Streptomyces phyllanthi]